MNSEFENYNLQNNDNTSVIQNKYQMLGKIKRIINDISNGEPLVVNIRAYNIHSGYSVLESGEYTDITISQFVPPSGKNSEAYTIKHTNWFLFDVKVFSDDDYIYIYIRARYKVYNSVISVQVKDLINSIRFFPNKYAQFEDLPTDKIELNVFADEYSSILKSRRTSNYYLHYIKILELDLSKVGISFTLSVYNNSKSDDNSRHFFQQFRINTGYGTNTDIINKTRIEKISGDMTDCLKFIVDANNKLSIYVSGYGSGDILKYKLSEISNVMPTININYINEFGKNDNKKYSMVYCTNIGQGDFNEYNESVNDNTGCCYSLSRLTSLGTTLPIIRQGLIKDDLFWTISSSTIDSTTQGKSTFGTGIVSNNLYFSIANDWIGIQFKVATDGVYLRRYYGSYGWNNYVKIQ